jgi:lipopolysaccharide export system protein LptA
MRRARWLILLAIILLISAVGNIYHSQRKLKKSGAIAPPPALASNLNASMDKWCYTQMDGDRPVVTICADTFEQTKDNNTGNLRGMDLKIFRKGAQEYDKVTSASAVFNKSDGTLVSEGNVEITMGVPVDAKPKGRLLNIKSAAVKFDVKSGKAETDQPASFTFEQGEGHAVGALYDPSVRELTLKSNVQLIWRGKKKGADMKVESGWLLYKERESLVLLTPWSKLTRGSLKLEAGNSVVHLDEGVIRDVEAQNARGTDDFPNRQVEYAAKELRMEFDEDGVTKKIVGLQEAKLVSTAHSVRTTVNSDRIDLDFANDSGDSVLQKAFCWSHSVAESKPIPQPKALTPDTRILRADAMEMIMRPGGKEIEKISTHTAGQMEFLPNRPGQRRRLMDAERMTITYGEKNQIRNYRAANVATKTFREPKKKGDPGVALTWSKDLSAEFDPKTSQMQKLEQWQDFRYEEGDRKARADGAVLVAATDRITLNGHARVWDPTGSTAGDRIEFDQKSSDFVAEGNVTSTRQPDKKAKTTSMLSGDEALQAKAKKMYSKDEQSVIYYEGNAVLWQGASRLHADFVTIDRENQTLAAKGNVFSQFVDQGKKEKGKPAPKQKPAPVYTTVRAPELIYTDETKLADYRGGATLARPNLDVKAKQIKAWLTEDEDGGTSLDHAFAIGDADIVQRSPARTRHSTGEHAEYYVEDEKVSVEGGNPQVVDSVKGVTRGRKITWFANDDRLLVDGAERQPVKTILRRKK